MAQQTLEEFKKRFSNDESHKNIKLDYQDGIYYGIEVGAKWQQENMCVHSYILTSEQGHRVIKCTICNNIQPI